jgi:hypothetical protein
VSEWVIQFKTDMKHGESLYWKNELRKLGAKEVLFAKLEDLK